MRAVNMYWLTKCDPNAYKNGCVFNFEILNKKYSMTIISDVTET